jgi:predicted RecB family nuclease
MVKQSPIFYGQVLQMMVTLPDIASAKEESGNPASMFSATDIVAFLACRHLRGLEQDAAAGKREKPFFKDPSQELLRELGLRHEQNYLRLLDGGKNLAIVHIPEHLLWLEAVTETTKTLHSGADVIYQGALADGSWGGRSDFLIKVKKPSLLGSWSYEVTETKLARSARTSAVLQLCFYSDILDKIQGGMPEQMHVVLGDSRVESFEVARYIAYFRKVRNEFLKASQTSTATYPEPVELCRVCTWNTVCDKQRHADDHLSLVAGITKNQRKQLVARDIQTLEALGCLQLPVFPKIANIGEAALGRIQGQARLQRNGRNEAKILCEILEPIEEEKGFAALPARSPADVFLDFEGDGYAFGTGIEYLLGCLSLGDSSMDPVYESRWCFEPISEKQAFEEFIAKMLDTWSRFPDFHIYHYAPYEQTAIKRLAGRHGVCVDSVDRLLRAGVFVDLYRITRQALRASVESYSIKKLEPLYGFERAVPLRDARLALDTFASIFALGSGNETTSELKEIVESYNREDCLSARRLRDWLEERRAETEKRLGRTIPRPAARSGDAKENLVELIERVEAVKKQLLEKLPADRNGWTKEQESLWLLAQLLEWHRREEKSMWWEYFRMCDLSDAELIEDKNTLGGLRYVGEAARVKRSAHHRYDFPPQDHAIDRALSVHDPKTKSGAGELVAIDEIARTIDLKRGLASIVPHPGALIPYDFVGSEVKRESLLRLATWVVQNGVSSQGPFQAARDLLLRERPRALRTPIDNVVDAGQLTKETNDLVQLLCTEPSILPIQGPPGSGKTFSGARMVVEVVKSGRRVGVTAISHKVISHLLGEACKVARAAGVPLTAVQKSNETDGCSDESVKQLDDNAHILDALQKGSAMVAAGTGWLWSRSEMRQAIDVLFIDEAGQMCLADVLAVSQSATSCVLLGDPQQLDQPQRGVHPPGADGSTFRYLLGGRATILPEQGLFLRETQRLHPKICEFTSELFYENRLRPALRNDRQSVNAKGRLSGTGLRFVAVNHIGNQNESTEEVETIANLVRELLDGESSWTKRTGDVLKLTLDDILVVTPYNAQVSALLDVLPKGAHVGTVDKFQGQEAPIVFYSMATSTASDAPRGMEFLYSSNRLNVAISRARCLAVVVACPALFEMECKSPRQMMLANAFCRYLERAQPV